MHAGTVVPSYNQ